MLANFCLFIFRSFNLLIRSFWFYDNNFILVNKVWVGFIISSDMINIFKLTVMGWISVMQINMHITFYYGNNAVIIIILPPVHHIMRTDIIWHILLLCIICAPGGSHILPWAVIQACHWISYPHRITFKIRLIYLPFCAPDHFSLVYHPVSVLLEWANPCSTCWGSAGFQHENKKCWSPRLCNLLSPKLLDTSLSVPSFKTLI